MTPRQIAMELLKTQIDEAAACKLLDEYPDAELSALMASKQGAVAFIELLANERIIAVRRSLENYHDRHSH